MLIRFTTGRWRLLLICLMPFLFEQIAVAIEGDGGLYRRGYPADLTVQAAIDEYNAVHRADLIANQYPELQAAEIGKAIARQLKDTPPKSQRRRERLNLLAKLVAAGRLPKGTLLAFQYADKNRTRYWHDWVNLSDSFAIILWSGMNENPPEDSAYNDDAYIIGVTVRAQPRHDKK